MENSSERIAWDEKPRKIGRNELCPCGSRLKYKKCCGSAAAATQARQQFIADVKKAKQMAERLHVWSVGCFWHGPIEAAGRIRGMHIPCCPHCGSVLYQCSQDQWDAGSRAHEAKGAVNYCAFMAWAEGQGKCWPSIDAAAQEFTAKTGFPVIYQLSKGEPEGSAEASQSASAPAAGKPQAKLKRPTKMQNNLTPFDLIRTLVTALTTTLNTPPKDTAALAAANSQIASLQSQLNDAKAQIGADEAQIASFGSPLTADEINHIGDVLTAVANNDTPTVPPPPTPPVATPAEAPAPTVAGVDTQPPGDAQSAGPVDTTATGAGTAAQDEQDTTLAAQAAGAAVPAGATN